MCHAWNKIMEDTEDHLKELLAQYITDKEGLIDFSNVRSKLTSASEGELSELASHILKAYF
jgi:Ca2+-binding EF-hand superfamily protein